MPRYVWEEHEAVFLFHYTEYAAAQSIEESLLGRPGSGGHYGLGFYATDLAPTSDVESIHRQIFPDRRVRIWDAVVVLELREGHPFREEAEHHFRAPGEPNDSDDVLLADFVIGIGRFLDATGTWDLDEDLIVP